MTTLEDLAVSSITEHPKNPRHRAVADQELVDSIRSSGLIQPLVVAPIHDPIAGQAKAMGGEVAPTRYVLIAGHRRLDGLKKAKSKKAPALIRTDLVTEGQQVEAMLIENVHREDLTAVEEAEGYAQLELFGYKAKDIAKAIGRSPATVRARLKLTHLPEVSLAKLHEGQMSIADAEALLEFEDDPEQLAELESAIGTSNFRYRVEQAKQDKESRARWRKMIAEFQGVGATQIEWPGSYNSDEGPVPLGWTFSADADQHPAGEAGCLAWTHSGTRWTDPLLVCTNPASHPQPETKKTDNGEAARREQWERDQAAREEERAKQQAAARVRIDHLMAHFTGLFTTKTVLKLQLDVLRITLPALMECDALDTDAYRHASGMGLDNVAWWNLVGPHVEEIRGMTTAALLKTHAAIQAAVVEDQLSQTSEPGCVPAWDWLLATGYQPSDVDNELLAEARQEQHAA